MRVQTYNLRGKNLPNDLVYQIQAIVTALEAIPSTPVVISPKTGFTPQQEQFVKGLLGAFAQTPIGTDVADPLLQAVTSADGTVTSVTVSAGNQLTGGGTVTTSGTITLGVTATPSFTTVNVTTQYNVAGTKVVGARNTGWTPWTGASTKATFDTATATLVDVAQTLKALLDALTLHGLIGV